MGKGVPGSGYVGGTGKTVYSDEELWKLFEEQTSTSKVARITGYAQSHVRSRLAAIRESMGLHVKTEDVDRAGLFEKLLASIPLVGPSGAKLKKVFIKQYGMGAKDELTQKIVKEGLDSSGAEYTLERELPDLPLVHQGPKIKIEYKDVPWIARKTRVIPIISDAQIGWLKHPQYNQLTPIHDPTALDVAKQVVSAVTPDGIVFIGDWLDWQFMSRWQQYPEYDSANPSIKTGKEELGEFCSASGKRTEPMRIMVGSNHGDRPEKFILERNLFAVGIRRGGDTSKWPVFSEPYLLQYEDFNVQFSGHYGSLYWITSNLVCTHAPPKPGEFDASVFHGHTHHLRVTPYVIHGHDGESNRRKEHFIYDTGALCRTDSTTDKARLMLLSVPSNRPRSSWTQGMAVINIVDGKFPVHSVELIHIQDGRALYRGQDFSASRTSRSILENGVKAA